VLAGACLRGHPRFTPVTDGTRVDREHRGWERVADGGELRTSYDGGWSLVIGCYVDAAG
jgi:hypothetical protein